LIRTGANKYKNKATFKEALTKPEYKYATFLSFSLYMLSCLNGINGVMFYSNTMIKKMGTFDPVIGTMILGMSNLMGSITSFIFIHNFKRKSIMITG
jgi:hypothetical protein